MILTLLKKYFFVFVVIPIFTSKNNLNAFLYSNKNHLTTKSATPPFFAIEQGWYHSKRCCENKINCKTGLSIQASFFHTRSRNKKKIGKYFGCKQKADLSLASGINLGVDVETEDLIHKSINDNFSTSFAGNVYTYHKPNANNPLGYITTGTNTAPITDFRVFFASLVEKYQNETEKNTLNAELSLSPERRTTGVLFSFFGCNKKNNLWFQLNLPLAKVKHSLNLEINNTRNFTGQASDRDVTIFELLSGQYSHSSATDGKDEQVGLKYAKLYKDWKEEVQLVDPELIFGARVSDKTDLDIDIFTKLSLPTSSKCSPEFIFPVQVGNNGHFKLSFGSNVSTDLWQNKDIIHAELLCHTNIGYAFPTKQQRTFNSYSDRGCVIPWSKYSLFAKEGSSGPLNPFANIGTIEIKAFPGFFAEGNLMLGLSIGNFSINLGGGFSARQAEKIDIENWPGDGLYGRVPPISYRTDMVYKASNFVFEGLDDSTTTKSELDLQSVSSPEAFQTQLFGQLFYHSETPNPRGVGVGVSYEFSNSNSSIDQLSIWAKITASF